MAPTLAQTVLVALSLHGFFLWFVTSSEPLNLFITQSCLPSLCAVYGHSSFPAQELVPGPSVPDLEHVWACRAQQPNLAEWHHPWGHSRASVHQCHTPGMATAQGITWARPLFQAPGAQLPQGSKAWGSTFQSLLPHQFSQPLKRAHCSEHIKEVYLPLLGHPPIILIEQTIFET